MGRRGPPRLYVLGEPCPHCGVVLTTETILTKGGGRITCRQLSREQSARRNREHSDKVKQYNARWRRNNPNSGWEGHLRRNYKKTAAWYYATLEKQDHRCANKGCQKHIDEYDQRFCVDHDHGCCPGERSCGDCVRGLLCRRCNTLEGTIFGPTGQGLLEYIDRWADHFSERVS